MTRAARRIQTAAAAGLPRRPAGPVAKGVDGDVVVAADVESLHGSGRAAVIRWAIGEEASTAGGADAGNAASTSRAGPSPREEGAMPVDLTVYLTDQPGQLAAVSRRLADADVNIDGYFALVAGHQGIMHVLVGDEAGASAARTLRDAGFEVREEQEVLVVDCEDRPGTLAEHLEPIGAAGVNLSVSYLATGTRLVVGGDDLEAIRAALAAASPGP
jgi:hypothetical protein